MSPAAPENDAPVLDAADKAATITVNNETSYEVDVAACLSSDAAIRAEGDGPQVLIVHTHGSESYTPDAAFPYTPTENERTTDTRYNVVRVGDELQKVLEQNGVQAVHIREIFDSPAYSGSYDRSLAAIEDALAEYPTIQVVIDLHRDSILTDDGEAYKTSCTIDGEEMAQLMFVVGTDAGRAVPSGLAAQPQLCDPAAIHAQPRLSRPDAAGQPAHPALQPARESRFDAGRGRLVGNTMPEALAAIRLFGQTLADDLTGA